MSKHGLIVNHHLKFPILKLNIGCGLHIEPTSESWANIDQIELPGVDITMNFEDCARGGRLPLPDDSVEFIYASHILEHITNILPFMSELWRVSKPGAHLMVRVPHLSSDAAFEDPTHVRFFTPKSLLYFGQQMYNAADYNYKADWEAESTTVVISDYFDGATTGELEMLLSQARNVATEIWCDLIARKPARAKGEDAGRPMPIKLVLEKQMKQHLEQPRNEPQEIETSVLVGPSDNGDQDVH